MPLPLSASEQGPHGSDSSQSRQQPRSNSGVSLRRVLPVALIVLFAITASYLMNSRMLVRSVFPQNVRWPVVKTDYGGRESSNSSINVDLVVGLRGEMGNYLGVIAHARAIQLAALEEDVPPHLRFNFTLRFRCQGIAKTIQASKDVQDCFPENLGREKVIMNEFNYSAPEWNEIWTKQINTIEAHFPEWKSMAEVTNSVMITAQSIDDIKWNLNRLRTVIARMKSNGTFVTSNFASVPRGEVRPLSSPFLVTESFLGYPLINRYYDEIKSFLAFDEDRCCASRPDPDESVFHYRGFIIELPKRGKSLGFEELSPNQTADQLFYHLQHGDKVAILSRFHRRYMQPYVRAIQDRRNAKVRIVDNQSGVQDFCFLKSATKEIMGSTMSTFFEWAALLSDNLEKVVVYTMDSSQTRNSGKINLAQNSSEFTNERLRRIFEFPILMETKQQ